MKHTNPIDILLIEGKPCDAKSIEAVLNNSAHNNHSLRLAADMLEATELLGTEDYQFIILDISQLADSATERVAQLRRLAPDLGIAVLHSHYDDALALETTVAGAQDFWVKGAIDEWQMTRTLNYVLEQKRIKEDVFFLAHHDQLTGLVNRTLFRTRLEHAIHSAERRNESVAVLYLDLDHFKSINDSLGHDTGDKILIETAHRLSKSIREVDTVARLGGDEFAIILEGVQGHYDATVVAKKVLAALMKPVTIDGHSLNIGTSMGITLYPECGKDADTLVKNADSAMYHAKHNGRNQYQLYTEH